MLEFRFLFIRLTASSPFAILAGAILVGCALLAISWMATSRLDVLLGSKIYGSVCQASDT